MTDAGIDRLYKLRCEAEAERDAAQAKVTAIQAELTVARRRLKAAQKEWERAATAWCDACDERNRASEVQA
jgi:hypothetical protein